jgi:hypothetical protein
LAEKRVVSVCVAKMDSLRQDNGRYKLAVFAQPLEKVKLA